MAWYFACFDMSHKGVVLLGGVGAGWVFLFEGELWHVVSFIFKEKRGNFVREWGGKVVGVYYLCEDIILAKKAIMENIDIRSVKQRFEIVGNSTGLDRAVEKAVQVAPTGFMLIV